MRPRSVSQAAQALRNTSSFVVLEPVSFSLVMVFLSAFSLKRDGIGARDSKQMKLLLPQDIEPFLDVSLSANQPTQCDELLLIGEARRACSGSLYRRGASSREPASHA